nr:hypothetical protein Cry52Nrm3_p009 [Cryptomonas curvata]
MNNKKKNWPTPISGLNKNVLLLFSDSIKSYFSNIKFLIYTLKSLLFSFSKAPQYQSEIVLFFLLQFYRNITKFSNFETKTETIYFFKNFDTFFEYLNEKFIYFFSWKNKFKRQIIVINLYLLRNIKLFYFHRFNSIDYSIKQKFKFFFQYLYIYHNKKIPKNIIFIFIIFEKFCLIDKIYLESINLVRVITFLKILGWWEKKIIFVKFLFYFILIFVFLHKNNYIEDRCFALSNIKLWLYFFIRIYKIALVFANNRKMNCKKTTFGNINLIRKNNISPSSIRIFRLLLEKISNNIRDFIIVIKQLMSKFFVKFLKETKWDNNFLFFINQKIVNKIEDRRIFFKNSIKRKSNEFRNIWRISPYNFYFTFKANCYYISSNFYKNNLKKKSKWIISKIEKISRMSIIQYNQKYNFWELQLYLAFFTKFNFNQFNFLNVEYSIFGNSTELFQKFIIMNSLPTFTKKYTQINQRFVFFMEKIEFFFFNQNKLPKLFLVNFLVSLSSNNCINEGKYIFSFVLKHFNLLSNKKKILSKIIEFVLINSSTKNEFTKRCSMLVLWYLCYLNVDVSVFYIFKIYDILTTFRILNSFIFLVFLELLSFFFERHEQQKYVYEKINCKHYLAIFLFRPILNHSKRENKIIYAFFEESAYFFFNNCHSPVIYILKIAKIYKNNLDIISNRAKKSNLNLSLLYFNCNIFTHFINYVGEKNKPSIAGLLFSLDEGIQDFFEKNIYFLLNFFNKVSKNIDIIILNLFIKFFSKVIMTNENHCLLALYFYFSSIETETKKVLLLFLSDAKTLLSFLFHKKYIEIWELFKDEDYNSITKAFIFYHFLLNNCYLQIIETAVEIIIYNKNKNICIQNYSKKIFDFISQEKIKNSSLIKFSFSQNFFSFYLLSEIDFLSVVNFHFFFSDLSSDFKNFCIIIRQLFSNFKSEKIWRKITKSLYIFNFFGLNLKFISKIFYLLIRRIKDNQTYNQFIKILLKLKTRNFQYQTFIERIIFKIKKNFKKIE